ncbi:hypothetical protein DERF_001465 [Dermatophagoides farinae]|uniref:Uncharacterized protein n=1 Tax=Dermatophagoides farinae TaxID=6954 RepID=A0A922L9N7_DERFA|nr:hypothetical protein DERF_001465 [Dermatophagoides farinae]
MVQKNKLSKTRVTRATTAHQPILIVIRLSYYFIRKKMDIRKEMITILDHNRFKKLSGKNNEEESILWTDIMMVITWTRQSNPLCSQQSGCTRD